MASPTLTRDQALSAKPIAALITAREKLPDGGERITVPTAPTRWQRLLLRLTRPVPRRFDLDATGVEVLALCDGQKTVRHIIDRFARHHRVNPHEAERAVTTFLQMMMRRGIVSVAVKKRIANSGRSE